MLSVRVVYVIKMIHGEEEFVFLRGLVPPFQCGIRYERGLRCVAYFIHAGSFVIFKSFRIRELPLSATGNRLTRILSSSRFSSGGCSAVVRLPEIESYDKPVD